MQGGGATASECACWPTTTKAAVWRGENTERFKRVVYPLAEVAGQRLQLELFDDEIGGWGHIMLDHVMAGATTNPTRFRCGFETMSDSDYLTWLTGGSTPVIRSDWDVYLVEDSLIYAKNQCGPGDVEPEFFLHVDPVDMNDLPSHPQAARLRRPQLAVRNHLLIEGGVCVARQELTDYAYAIAAIRTGQFTGEGQKIWEGSFDVAEPADDGKPRRERGAKRRW